MKLMLVAIGNKKLQTKEGLSSLSVVSIRNISVNHK